MSLRSCCSSGVSRENHVPEGSIITASPRTRAAKSSSKGTGMPSTVTVTCRSNQSCPPSSSSTSLVPKVTTGASWASA
ncbi:hypothetical protein [Ornithinimicrobium kibberense]|uniref:hypothetical protein n=1 Tax=Ornithinimicrobium kibberense TaxID=282060 RepID=UPI003622E8D2